MTINKELLKENVRKQVRHYFTEQLNIVPGILIGEGNGEELYVVSENTITLNESMLTESAMGKMIERNIDQYQFKFLEKGNEKHIFVRGQSNFKWLHFSGSAMIDSGEFGSDAEMSTYINDLERQGYKTVTKDAGLTKFFKSIGRGVSFILKVFAGMQVIGMIFLLIFALFAGTAAAGIPIAAVVGYQSAIVTTALAGGWIVGKISEKQELPIVRGV